MPPQWTHKRRGTHITAMRHYNNRNTARHVATKNTAPHGDNGRGNLRANREDPAPYSQALRGWHCVSRHP